MLTFIPTAPVELLGDHRADCGCTGQLPGVNVCYCVNVIRTFLPKRSETTLNRKWKQYALTLNLKLFSAYACMIATSSSNFSLESNCKVWFVCMFMFFKSVNVSPMNIL